ncbi:hypothetical protein RFI_05077 [Reticulomyxa filosa]|uniref:WD-40 repeat protein n=1 Tax=Reticulomyxa filosa TaxID=46433 RepID=X6P0F4_RETFI|nr:hypothetical protein RFI_05077 [Reticulomyxa filosa]|eukprot:ETO32040.1 hypothetical protein RFI_05077 [Reticulomyxa filosa]
MTTIDNEKQASMQLSLLKEEEKVQIIIRYWVRILNIKLGWINDFDKLVVKYITITFMFDTFHLSSKLLKTFTGHTDTVWSIDYSTFDSDLYICSGSEDKTVRAWDVHTNKQIQLFNHSHPVSCVKFSQHHYQNHCRYVICFSSDDNIIHFWDFKNNRQLQTFNGHTDSVYGIKFSSFNSGGYLCSGSGDKTIRLWSFEASESLHVFNGHANAVWCVDISSPQNNNNINDIGAIGGNGYTICSGSWDNTICIWDIETTKQLIVFKGHENIVKSVKYSLNIGANTILSGSNDKSVRLWDIRSGQQIQIFNGHTGYVNAVEYSPFIVDNIEIGGSPNVICSGSRDNTIRFWDIRSNKKELYAVNGNRKEDYGILCLKFLQLKKSYKKSDNDCDYDINLCYSSWNGPIHIWG